MTTDERLDRLVERHEALAQSVDLLVLSSRDLRAAVEATLARQREERADDAKYIAIIRDVLSHWTKSEER